MVDEPIDTFSDSGASASQYDVVVDEEFARTPGKFLKSPDPSPQPGGGSKGKPHTKQMEQEMDDDRLSSESDVSTEVKALELDNSKI